MPLHFSLESGTSCLRTTDPIKEKISIDFVCFKRVSSWRSQDLNQGKFQN